MWRLANNNNIAKLSLVVNCICLGVVLFKFLF